MKYIILWLTLLVVVEGSLIKDFFTTVSLWPKKREIYTQNNNDFKNIPAVQYELPFENEEFLREGLALIDLNFSQLDLCQHRAISLLTKSCNQLTSEEIGKLGIMLLNCQFEGEGRGTYPCTTEMTLKQCTIGMDNNAYQISHEELIKQYKQSLEFLANFKGVLQTLSHIANHIQGYIQTFFLLLEEVGINTSEENIAFICINLLYFVSGMVFLLFINAANTCKYIFICLIVFNALSQIFNMEIPLIPLNIFLWMAYGGYSLMKWFNKKICDVNWFSWWPIRNVNEGEDDSDDQEVILTTPSKKQMTPQKIQNPLQTEVQPKITVKNFSSLMNSKDDNEMSQIYFDTTVAMKSLDKSNNRPETPDNRPVTPYIVRSSTPFERPLTPAMRRVMSESLPISRSGTPFTIGMNNRTQCQSLTAKGLQCRNAAVQGLTKCRVHNY